MEYPVVSNSAPWLSNERKILYALEIPVCVSPSLFNLFIYHLSMI